MINKQSPVTILNALHSWKLLFWSYLSFIEQNSSIHATLCLSTRCHLPKSWVSQCLEDEIGTCLSGSIKRAKLWNGKMYKLGYLHILFSLYSIFSELPFSAFMETLIKTLTHLYAIRLMWKFLGTRCNYVIQKDW